MYLTECDVLGSTSVGIMAIQMLKASECRVVTSCSAKNIDFVKQLGADEVSGAYFIHLQTFGTEYQIKTLGT